MEKLDEFAPNDMFFIQDVDNDNACFYRSIANQLYYKSFYDKCIMILSRNNCWRTKQLENLDKENWGYNGPEQTKTSKVLQQISRKFIYKNRDKKIPELGIKVYELVSMVHDLSEMRELFPGWEDIDIYNHIYKSFAGDNVMVHNGNKYIKIKERWGSAVEQWALSEHLKVPIIIWELCKHDKRTGEIKIGRIRNNIATKNSFFKIQQIFGRRFSNTPLNILYRNSQGGSHYMSLYHNEKY